MTTSTWKQLLIEAMPEKMSHEIDIFESQMELRRQGKIEDKVFAETRLRRGAYGQRYDNGQRHDGVETRALNFPNKGITKGPDTEWDAPGMVRIKIPYGKMSPDQMDVLAELAEEYSDGILHVTTRQDIQLHYVHIDDTPDLMRRLAAVNITTREACGNSVRNVTGCPLTGVCHTEAFDVSPYADALVWFMMGHPDVQDFGRKFKVAFSGCADKPCGLTNMHDMGLVTVTKEIDGVEKRGFKMYVGGGLGAVPHDAQLVSDFVSEEELLPMSQAVARVFARLGEKKNRNKARVKFLVANLGIEEFRKLVFEERPKLAHDDQWTAYLKDLPHYKDEPLKDAVQLNVAAVELPAGYDAWASTNVYTQRQPGYAAVTISLPLGDYTAAQSRQLAQIARKYVGDSIRATVEQNIVLRWVSEADLPAMFSDLVEAGLAEAGAGTIIDMTACPGTDTCKLGIAASRGLAGELRERFIAKMDELPEAVKNLKIKMSGCFNSCGQHHLADIGFYGNSRKVGNKMVPHFQVVLGGEWTNNGGTYGLAMGAVPSKSCPDVVDALTGRYLDEREGEETFLAWVQRSGKKAMRDILKPFMVLPDYDLNRDAFTDWGDTREFSIGDMGVGECAGEMVSLFEMEIAKAESEAFDAQLALEDEDFTLADQLGYSAMLIAARGLIIGANPDITREPNHIVDDFKTRYFDTELFFHPQMKGIFAGYLFARHEKATGEMNRDLARKTVEESQLFIEACHACDLRMSQAQASA